MTEVKGKLMIVPPGIHVWNPKNGEVIQTTPSRRFLVSEDGGNNQYPVNGSRLQQAFSFQDGRSIVPDTLRDGRRYSIKRLCNNDLEAEMA